MSSYQRILRHRDFRYLFLGQAASAVGDQVVIVALALFITRQTGSPTDLGLVLAAQALPMVSLMLFGGVWADRLPRHRIMIVADVSRAALHFILAALIFTGAPVKAAWRLASMYKSYNSCAETGNVTDCSIVGVIRPALYRPRSRGKVSGQFLLKPTSPIVR